jgi:DNA-3-methyladenine glycosylase
VSAVSDETGSEEVRLRVAPGRRPFGTPAGGRDGAGTRTGTRTGERLRRVPREFFAGDSLAVAPELLHKLLVRDERVLRIVEVEAYRGEEDPASHAYRGPTRRNRTMFGRPGLLYVYLSYGVHWCANVVCGEPGVARAVLLRAAAPVAGLAALRAAAPGLSDRELASGPGRLGRALGLTGDDDGADLVEGDRGILLLDDGTPPPPVVASGPRVGVSRAGERPWRFFVPGDPHVSRPRPGPARGTLGRPPSAGRAAPG